MSGLANIQNCFMYSLTGACVPVDARSLPDMVCPSVLTSVCAGGCYSLACLIRYSWVHPRMLQPRPACPVSNPSTHKCQGFHGHAWLGLSPIPAFEQISGYYSSIGVSSHTLIESAPRPHSLMCWLLSWHSLSLSVPCSETPLRVL